MQMPCKLYTHVQLAARQVATEQPRAWLRFLNVVLNDMHYGFSTAFEGLETVHDIDFAAPDPNEQPIARFVRQTEERERIMLAQRQTNFLLDYSSGLLLLLRNLAQEAGEGESLSNISLGWGLDSASGCMVVCGAGKSLRKASM
jgi:hypothetical protein